jgi:hypothetical protein
LAANPTRLTIPAGVSKVRLKANINWTFGGSGYRHVWVHKNGVLFFGTAKENDLGDSGVQSIGTAVVNVAPGDYFELIAARPPARPRTSRPTSSPGSPSRCWSDRWLSSGIPAAQKLWHVSKAHRLELFKEGFWWRAVVQPATLAAVRTRHALPVPVKATPIF